MCVRMLTSWLHMCFNVALMAREVGGGTSLAMVQGKALPVLVVEPIFRVPMALQRDTGAVGGCRRRVPQTVVGGCDGRQSVPSYAFFTRSFAAAALSTTH